MYKFCWTDAMFDAWKRRELVDFAWAYANTDGCREDADLAGELESAPPEKLTQEGFEDLFGKVELQNYALLTRACAEVGLDEIEIQLQAERFMEVYKGLAWPLAICAAAIFEIRKSIRGAVGRKVYADFHLIIHGKELRK